MSKRFFSRKHSKIITIDSIVKALNESSMSEDKLMIHTANGIYIGILQDYVEPNNLELQDEDDVLTSFDKIYLSTLEKFEAKPKAEDNIDVIENPISIKLKDVQLLTSGNTINMPFAIIFVDQIIGFSTGHI